MKLTILIYCYSQNRIIIWKMMYVLFFKSAYMRKLRLQMICWWNKLILTYNYTDSYSVNNNTDDIINLSNHLT